MDRIKKIFRRIHLITWICFSLLVSWQLMAEENSQKLTTGLGFMLTSLYVFYGHFYLLTYYQGKKKKTAYFLRLAGILFTGPLVYILFNVSRLHTFAGWLGSYGMMLITIVPLFAFLGWLARITETLVINTVKKEQLEKQAAEAELHYLKSQINPHFLFNTLNNIHTLVYKQAPAAPDAVMQLATLMRYMIYESNAATVPLERELEYLRDYMSLQQLRYKHDPVAELTIKGVTGTCHIAALLFIHLLENAYKHSPSGLQPGDLKVTVEVNDNSLTFRVQNPVGKKQVNKFEMPGGVGLPNVRKRLALLYPHCHSLDINDSGERFEVVLRIHGLQTQSHERKAELLHH